MQGRWSSPPRARKKKRSAPISFQSFHPARFPIACVLPPTSPVPAQQPTPRSRSTAAAGSHEPSAARAGVVPRPDLRVPHRGRELPPPRHAVPVRGAGQQQRRRCPPRWVARGYVSEDRVQPSRLQDRARDPPDLPEACSPRQTYGPTSPPPTFSALLIS
jgi:hypothetical protein